jgi:hypothetical protein
MNSEKDSNIHYNVQSKKESDLPDNEDLNKLPF